MKIKKAIYRISLTVFVLLFAVSGFFIIRQLKATEKAASGFSEVSAMMHQQISAAEALQAESPAEADPGDYPAARVAEAAPAPAPDIAYDTRLIAYNEVHKKYSDFIGWIKIPGTAIDYPVMHTPNYPEFYLNRDFNKEKSSHGTPFLDYKCDTLSPSDNMILYGHNMKDGTMFANLNKYKDRAFFEACPTIEFDTLHTAGQYEIVAAFLGSGNTSGPDAFAYNMYTEFYNESMFNEFINEIVSRRLYDTGIIPSFGDKLLTLSTCEYSREDSRMVVMAREVRE